MKSIPFAVGLGAFFIAATCAARAAEVRVSPTSTASTAAHAVPANGPLSEADLLAIVRMADKTAPRDAFSKPEPERYADRKFSLTRKAEWSYDPKAEAMTVSFLMGGNIDLDVHSDITGKYLAENVFGAAASVSKVRISNLELTLTPNANVPGGLSSNLYYRTFSSAPEEARGLSKRLDVLIEGKTVIGDGGTVAYCRDDEVAPTLSTPLDIHGHTCGAYVVVSHIAIRDSSTGKVLAEWPVEP